MTSRSQLFIATFAVLGFVGANPGGCGLFTPPPQPLPPVVVDGGPATTGGSGGGTSGSTGGALDGGCMEACDSLDETDCRARPDCEAIYVTDGCAQRFDHCQAQGSCHEDSDCAPDEYCARPLCNSMECDQPGTCQPKPVCPDVACSGDPTNPNSLCFTTTDPSGCPTCTCEAVCSNDSDCGAGEHCAPGPNTCACPVDDPTCECAQPPWICQPESCTQDSDCKGGEVCQLAACPAGLPSCDEIPPGTQPPCCPTEGQCVASAPTYPCGSGSCTADQVCIFYGGARNTPECVDAPAACANASCDCYASELCGSGAAASADCSGPIPSVSCGYP